MRSLEHVRFSFAHVLHKLQVVSNEIVFPTLMFVRNGLPEYCCQNTNAQTPMHIETLRITFWGHF